MKSDEPKGILLENGTNELEIIEFGIDDIYFGINVAKVREILLPGEVTRIPHTHPYIQGIIPIRGEVLPVIDLPKALHLPPLENNKGFFIVSEFNQLKVIFYVQTVHQIHRISWEKIEKPTDMVNGREGTVVGVVKLSDRLVQLLDFEKIVSDIAPETGIQVKNISKDDRRKESTILIAEDSPLLARMIETTLAEAGFIRQYRFPDGKQAWEYLEKMAQDQGEHVFDHISLVITDIEMPQMDGLHLTKRIKEHSILKKLPVVIFSSLISDDLRHKGVQVGADSQVSKPEIDTLIKKIDQLITYTKEAK